MDGVEKLENGEEQSEITASDKVQQQQQVHVEESEAMKPWEQHSAVISIPRYNYQAPTSLLQHSHSGFLITCPIKREKSATKEIMPILEKFVRSSNGCPSISLEISDGVVTAKRRKLHPGIVESKGSINVESKISSDDSSEDKTVETAHSLSLVKLTRSGLLLFTFPCDSSPDVVDVVENILQSLGSGRLKSPLWCHRIFPIQATCCLNEKDLRTIVSKLVVQFVDNYYNKLTRPIKFAVGYNRRGIEETEMKDRIKTSGKTDALFSLLDRNKCFELVAAAVKDAVSDSVVDLKCPELSILIELLPISGIPTDTPVVAVSVLASNLVTTKPRLCIKALSSETKVRNGVKNQQVE